MTPQSDLQACPLSIRRAAKRYGAIEALREVSLDVPAGSIVGLLGPNGAGKTTLIRMCAGWIEPDAGEVMLTGLRQTVSSLATRRCMGVVSRDAPLFDEFTVAETLRLHAALHGIHGSASADACAQAIDSYRLSDAAHRRVGVLSTGMRQRVAIACALLHRPAVLLLDEPTTGLDPEVRSHVWECLADAARSGVALLLTTHYLEEAARLCHSVHLLVSGSVSLTIAPGAGEAETRHLEHAYFDAVQRAGGTHTP